MKEKDFKEITKLQKGQIGKLQYSKEAKEERKQRTVRLCGVFTLRPVNEFKMASVLARSHDIKERASQ